MVALLIIAAIVAGITLVRGRHQEVGSASVALMRWRNLAGVWHSHSP